MRSPLNRALAALLASALAGCAATQPKVRHGTPFPVRIVLLPLDNQSLDLQGPLVVRNLLETYLAAAGISVADTRTVDEKLREIGISEGGQLGSATAQKLGEVLEVDALLYGEITEFKSVNVGVYASRIVEAKLWLVDARTGARLWEATQRKANSQASLSKEAAKRTLATGYAERAAENIRNSPLLPESEDVARQLIKSLNKARREW